MCGGPGKKEKIKRTYSSGLRYLIIFSTIHPEPSGPGGGTLAPAKLCMGVRLVSAS